MFVNMFFDVFTYLQIFDLFFLKTETIYVPYIEKNSLFSIYINTYCSKKTILLKKI